MAMLSDSYQKGEKVTTLLNYINSLKWFALIVFLMVFFKGQIIGILNRLTSFKVNIGGAQVEVDSSAPAATTAPPSEAAVKARVVPKVNLGVPMFHQTNYVARPSQSKLEIRVARWIDMGGNLFVEFEALNQTANEIANLIATATLTIGESTFENIHVAFPGTLPSGSKAFQIAYVSDSADIDEASNPNVNVNSTSRYSVIG